MDIEELRASIKEAWKRFLSGEFSLTKEETAIVHLTQILTYVDLSVEDYESLIDSKLEEALKEEKEIPELIDAGIIKKSGERIIPKNSLVIEAARRKGLDIPSIRRDPYNAAVLDLAHALDSLRISNKLLLSGKRLLLYVSGKLVYPVTIGIVQPMRAYGRSGEDVAKLWSYVPRFLSGSLGRKLLPIIIDLGISEILKNVPLIYLPLGILSLLVYYSHGLPAIAIFTPLYKKVDEIIR